MHRVNIVYTGSADSAFNWQYYLNKHLPIACGVSSRHAPIIRCDVDRPVDIGIETNAAPSQDTIVAVCTVYFSSLETQNGFRHFFASGHQDSAQILADEPNYTKIKPSFNAGNFKASDNTEAPAGYRVKFIFPRLEKPMDADLLDTAVDNLVTALENQSIVITSNEIDYCESDVPPGSTSVYECIVTLNVETQQDLAQIKRYLSTSKEQSFCELLGVAPFVIYAEVVNFNLALCIA